MAKTIFVKRYKSWNRLFKDNFFFAVQAVDELGHPSFVFLNQYDNNSKVKRLNGRFFFILKLLY
jgi:hypothetical protein